MSVERRERIRTLNDQLRQTHVGGRILMSQGVMSMGPEGVVGAMLAIAKANDFNEDNDPYGEHDFGAVTVSGQRIFWKIDYYNQSLTSQAVDPSYAKDCVRVLTVMLAEEY
ncbi:DUF3768 domain-containing protein [Brevundimonas sp. SL161]|uniref:DUF3768 domain-containing protein n=1 Tax=Brevundimonas sp. SL161 TaxID=2804613 RepID=UPI003CFB353B